jgi:hypothetical protein
MQPKKTLAGMKQPMTSELSKGTQTRTLPQKSSSEIIRAYCRVARPMLLEWMPRNSCIGSARVTLEYLKRCGIPARVQAVKFAVFDDARELAYCSGLTMQEMATARDRKPMWHGRGWNGHLIVIAAGRYIIDPSFDQALIAMGLPPESGMLLVESDDSAMQAGGLLKIDLNVVMDCRAELRVQYIPLADDGYLTTEAWTDEGLPFLATDIAARIEEI